jgi:RNA polymerase sigma-70 factor (ECF subfamily)
MCTVQLSFVAALQRMPPRQAAVLILSDVLGFPRAETARILDMSPVAVKSALQRARTATHDTGPCAASRRADADAAIAGRFATAFAADDVDAIVAILSDDAWLTMPPAPHEYQGPVAIAAFLGASRAWRGSRRYRLVPKAANHSPAFALHLDDGARPAGLVVLEIHTERLVGITRFLSTTPLARGVGSGHR